MLTYHATALLPLVTLADLSNKKYEGRSYGLLASRDERFVHNAKARLRTCLDQDLNCASEQKFERKIYKLASVLASCVLTY